MKRFFLFISVVALSLLSNSLFAMEEKEKVSKRVKRITSLDTVRCLRQFSRKELQELVDSKKEGEFKLLVRDGNGIFFSVKKLEDIPKNMDKILCIFETLRKKNSSKKQNIEKLKT